MKSKAHIKEDFKLELKGPSGEVKETRQAQVVPVPTCNDKKPSADGKDER